MLQVSQTLLSAINNPTMIAYFLVKVGNSFGVTDAPYDIEYSSFSYSADGGLASISPPKAESEISRDLFEIQLGDVTGIYREFFDSQSVGIPIEVLCGFIDTELGSPIGEYLPVYVGKVSKISWSTNANSPMVVVQSSGPLTKLKQVTERSTNSSNQQLYYPADTSMDYAYNATNEATIKWGGTT